MRDTASAVAQLPGHLALGPMLRRLFDRALDEDPELERKIMGAIDGPHGPEVDPDSLNLSETDLASLRQWLAQVLRVSDTGPVDNGLCSTPIRAALLARWAEAAADPGAGVAEWCTAGAPAGLTRAPGREADVFPRDRDDAWDAAALETFERPENFTNYRI